MSAVPNNQAAAGIGTGDTGVHCAKVKSAEINWDRFI